MIPMSNVALQATTEADDKSQILRLFPGVYPLSVKI